MIANKDGKRTHEIDQMLKAMTRSKTAQDWVEGKLNRRGIQLSRYYNPAQLAEVDNPHFIFFEGGPAPWGALQALKKSGAYEKIHNAVTRNGTVYYGTSAGALLASNDMR